MATKLQKSIIHYSNDANIQTVTAMITGDYNDVIHIITVLFSLNYMTSYTFNPLTLLAPDTLISPVLIIYDRSRL